MSDDKKLDLEEIMTETDEGEKVAIYKLDDPFNQFFVANETTMPGYIVLVNFHFGIGFALPYEMAHVLSHMIHDGLEALSGGEQLDEETAEPKKIITH